jgi:hypothetical protein
MLGKIIALGKWESRKSWQAACSAGQRLPEKDRQEIERIGHSLAAELRRYFSTATISAVILGTREIWPKARLLPV